MGSAPGGPSPGWAGTVRPRRGVGTGNRAQEGGAGGLARTAGGRAGHGRPARSRRGSGSGAWVSPPAGQRAASWALRAAGTCPRAPCRRRAHGATCSPRLGLLRNILRACFILLRGSPGSGVPSILTVVSAWRKPRQRATRLLLPGAVLSFRLCVSAPL